MVIPILFIGSITVLLNSFPIQVYQDFLDSFLGGAVRNILLIVQVTTVGVLALYITVAVNISYMNQEGYGERLVYKFGSLLSCVTGFFIIVGFFSGDPDFSLLSGQGVFSALLSGIIGSILYRRFETAFKIGKKIFIDGADSEFNAAIQVILPFLCVTLCFAVANYLIMLCFDVQSVQHLFMKWVDAIFLRMQRSYASGLLFTLLISIMWFFGIHGNNVLNQVAEDMFTEIIPGQIVSKSFMDTFAIMGGTGCLIGLLIAMIIFGRRSSTKKLYKMALVPCCFNISEMLVFGFPILYNPLMALPFIISPVLCYTNAYVLTKIGFLPEISNAVIWTTPPLMSGFLATGSYRGVVVQLINIAISTACYAPFVVMYEKKSLDEYSSSMNELIGSLKKNEKTTEELLLTESEGNAERLAKFLSTDLEASMKSVFPDEDPKNAESPILVHYQPQFDNAGNCIGAEALLRWNHKRYGVVYPPLVIQLARESDNIYELETYILERAIRDSESFRKKYGNEFTMSINLTIKTLFDERFLSFLQSMAERYKLRSGNICLEIREEPEMKLSDEDSDIIKRIRMYGYVLALDDFSMSQTSLQYLQHNGFDMVKLDGNLVGSLLGNDRTKEVINSIVYLSKSLDFKVSAKYVETAEQKEALEQIGINMYQGYMFSPAVDKEELIS